MLQVRLLGDMRADLDGRAIAPPASRRAWALLAWLALHPGEHDRGTLAARFWPDVLDTSARGSLRSAVWALRPPRGPAEAAGAGPGRGGGASGPGRTRPWWPRAGRWPSTLTSSTRSPSRRC